MPKEAVAEKLSPKTFGLKKLSLEILGLEAVALKKHALKAVIENLGFRKELKHAFVRAHFLGLTQLSNLNI